VTVRSINDDGELTSGIEKIACDLLAVSGGWSPLVHLHSQRQGKLRWDEDLAAFVPSTVVPNQQTIGSGRGSFELQDCLAEGVSAGASAAIAAGFSTGTKPAPLTAPKASAPTRQLWLVPGEEGTPDDWHHHFVDFQRDQSVADVLRSTGAGMRSVEHIKRYTSISTANDQGKTSGVNAIGVIAAALRTAGEASRGIGDIGTTTYRAPFTPVAFAALAGASAASCSTPPASPPSTRGTSPRAPCSRTWGSGSGPGTTRRPARTWTPPCCASAPPSATRWALWTPPPWARSRSGARTPASS
jgi:sarcosine oxidase subunit alpha